MGELTAARPKYLLAFSFVLLFLLVYFIPFRGDSGGMARSGTAEWHEESMTLLPLSGEWAVRDRALALDGWEDVDFAVLPYTWKESHMGFASYRVRVTGLNPGKVYSLLIPYQATAYALYRDRELVSSNGRVGASREDSVPEYRPRVVTFSADGTETELVLQVSNFFHRRGGPFQTLYFGDPEAVRKFDAGRALADGMLAFVYLVMGLYLFVFFLARKDRSVAFLAFFLLFAGVNGLVGTREVVLFRLFPAFPWFLYQKLCYFAAYGSPTWLFLFVYQLYGGLPRRQAAGVVVPFLGIFLFVLLTPPWIFSYMNNVFQLYTLCVLGMVFAILLAAVRARVRGSGVVLAGFLLLGTAVVSGIFFSNDRIQSGAMMPLGFLEYYRVTLFQRYSLSLLSLSYLFTLAFVGIFVFSYFFRHPFALCPGAEGARPEPMDLSEAGSRFGLSPREVEIARAVLEGKSNKEIADVLYISLSTVKTHISRVFRKVGVDSRSGLFRRLRPSAPEPPPGSDEERRAD